MTLGDALELVVVLVEALDAVQMELVALDETPVPLAERVLKQLEERDALAATLKRLTTDAPDTREHVEAVYREEAAKVCRTDDGGTIPVHPDVKAQLAETYELMRRRALVDSDLGAALDGALLRSAYADIPC